jgi:hypothetical protein
MPFFILAIYLGKKAYAELNETVIKKGVLALLFLSGVMLLFK